ncbi:Flp pilus assembly protein TadD [Marinobacter pelagius]|uniref:Flp pilus assembly protein TadD n=1 Tax=Marinobacter pelagius TaxID=379482 RepID=A0A366GDN7_9GAMM|nr:hypothetical protein [Marinobacter pelagius]RBP25052.1 Flp pilus assembly protein TadD [Marinobacter pelagius]
MKLIKHREVARAKVEGVGALLISALLAGCAASPEADKQGPGAAETAHGAPVYNIGCSTTLQPEHRVELDLVDSLMEASEHYAALAQLESVSFDTQQHWLRWAQLLAEVGQLEYAAEAFTAIAERCGSFEAYHGLGIVKVKENELAEALQALARAKALAPAVAEVRNDYGYALLLNGEYGVSAFELRTAYELSRQKNRVVANMVAAYYLNGGKAAMSQLRRELGLSSGQLAAGEQLAKSLGRK